MNDWYFPQKVHEDAHKAYIRKTGTDPDQLKKYCLADLDFFFDVTFAHIEKLPPPKMKNNA